MRDGRRKPSGDLIEDADNDRLEREDLGTWDGLYHLSVFADILKEGESSEEAVTRLFGINRRVKWFRTALVEALEAAGFELRASLPDPYHYDVVLGTVLNEEVVESFEQCFEAEARRNPAWTARS